MTAAGATTATEATTTRGVPALEPSPDAMVLTDVLAALSDPVRLQIVVQLDTCGDERACGSFDLGLAKSTVTHHMRVLREAGLVASRDEGTRRLNRLRRADVDARFPGLLDSVLAHPEG